MTEPAPGTVPAEDVVNGKIKQLLKEEPVVVGYGVTWLFANAGEILLGHTHLINAAEWGTATSVLAPLVTTAVLGALAYVTRRFVKPLVEKVDPSLFE